MKTGTHEVVKPCMDGLMLHRPAKLIRQAQYDAEVYKSGESAKKDIRRLCNMTVEDFDNGK